MSEATVTMPDAGTMMAALKKFEGHSLSLDRYLYPEICKALAGREEVTSAHVVVTLQTILLRTRVGTPALMERMPELIAAIAPEQIRQEAIDLYVNT